MCLYVRSMLDFNVFVGRFMGHVLGICISAAGWMPCAVSNEQDIFLTWKAYCSSIPRRCYFGDTK